MSKEFSLSDIAEHNSKKDLFLIVHDKVYDCTSFVDEHPGGEEVMLDVGGQDATEAFEDVGHSDEARELLDGLLVGTYKRKEGDPAAKNVPSGAASAYNSGNSSSGLGVGVYALILIGGALAYFAYTNLQNQGKR